MTVTCPACSLRYKFDDARLVDQGAKTTCPTCEHLFVVGQPQVDPLTAKDSWLDDEFAEPSAASVLDLGDEKVALETYDFSTHGVILRVRQGLIDQEFHSLEEVREALNDGSIDYADELSEDGINWSSIVDIPTLESRLTTLRERLEAGETFAQRTTSNLVIGDDEEGDEDAPTMIVRASSLNIDFGDDDEGDDDEDQAPPPAAAALFEPAADDPETEAVDVTPEPPKVEVSPAKPTLTVPEPEKKSVLPVVGLVLVVLVVLAMILYSQGYLSGTQG